MGHHFRIVACWTIAVLVVLCKWPGENSAYADLWPPAETFESHSANGQYLARVVPATWKQIITSLPLPWLPPPQTTARKIPATVSLFDVSTGMRRPHWTVALSNEELPCEVLISDDGRFVVTLDNWGEYGYGGDVIAFYNANGQIKRYSLEEILAVESEDRDVLRKQFFHSMSSREWRSHSLLLFDGEGDSTTFGIWLEWRPEWLIWQLADGSRVEVTGERLLHWNEKGRQWARQQLLLPEPNDKPPYEVMRKRNEEAQAWWRRHWRRYENRITACRYLAYHRNAADRKLLETALVATHANRESEAALRRNADRALAIYDGIPYEFPSLIQELENETPDYFSLGILEMEIRLPVQKTNEGQFYVSVYPETVSPTNWRSAQPEYRTGKSLTAPLYHITDGTLKIRIHPIRPGSYWAKVIWDQVGPHEYNLSSDADMWEWRALVGKAPTAEAGDFETGDPQVFEIQAGQHTHVVLDCCVPGKNKPSE